MLHRGVCWTHFTRFSPRRRLLMPPRAFSLAIASNINSITDHRSAKQDSMTKLTVWETMVHKHRNIQGFDQFFKHLPNCHNLVTYLKQADKTDSTSPHTLVSLFSLTPPHRHKLHLFPPQLCFSTKPNFRMGCTAVLIHEASYKVNQATSLRTMEL